LPSLRYSIALFPLVQQSKSMEVTTAAQCLQRS
jgi:hypothetical protein